jgi:hypothetical protein
MGTAEIKGARESLRKFVHVPNQVSHLRFNVCIFRNIAILVAPTTQEIKIAFFVMIDLIEFN